MTRNEQKINGFKGVLREIRERIAKLEREDTDPDGDGHVGIWGYINNHEDILTRILERLDKLEVDEVVGKDEDIPF